MKPISAEDDGACMRFNNRFFGIAVALAALILAYYNSLSISSFVISDSDPYTYGIVVMLMGIVFLFLGVRDKRLEPSPTAVWIGAGSVLVAAYVLLLAYARVALSFWFISYRVDVLLIPVFLAGIVLGVFGAQGLARLKYQIIYLFFASGIVLSPLISLNASFTGLNAELVYALIKALGLPVVRSGLVISAASSGSISIASTCADIAAFIAIALFMIPLAYFYEGNPKRKLEWVASSVVLLFIFNIFRMSLIAVLWAYYGVGEAVATFHLFIGSVLFYASIIIMILVAGKFGLRLPYLRDYISESRKKIRLAANMRYAAVWAVAAGALAFALTVPYASSLNFGYYGFSGALSAEQSASIGGFLESSIRNAGYSEAYIGNESGYYAFALTNVTSGSRYVLLFNYGKGNGMGVPAFPKAGNITYTYETRHGLALNTFLGVVNGTRVAVDQFSMPYNASGRFVQLNYYFVSNSTNAGYCRYEGGYYGGLYTALYNAMLFRTVAAQPMCVAYGYLNSVG